jgi:L-fuconolactonase
MGPIVDAHQHFWDYGTYQTSWMEKPPYAGEATFSAIRRSFGPDDLAPELRAAGVQASIIIEAADDVAENGSILRRAHLHDWIAGVVGWVPLDEPDKAARMLDLVYRDTKFVGVRHLVNVEPDPDWILRPAVIEGLKLIASRRLTFDYVAILERHLEHIPRLSHLVPDLRIIIDHLGKPPILSPNCGRWSDLLKDAAKAPNVYAKISGLDAGVGDGWSAADVAPYINHAVAVFGPERLMFAATGQYRSFAADMRKYGAKQWPQSPFSLHMKGREYLVERPLKHIGSAAWPTSLAVEDCSQGERRGRRVDRAVPDVARLRKPTAMARVCR